VSADKEVAVAVSRIAGAEDLPLPAYHSEHASGMDLYAAVREPVALSPGEIRLVPTGIRIAVPPGYEGQVRARSGLALRHGLFVVNAPGTIDADYRGEVCVILGNFGRETFLIERGTRIAQLVIQQVVRARWEPRSTLDETSRGPGGFGHTGR